MMRTVLATVMLLNPVPHDAAHSREAKIAHLAPQLSGIVTTVLPSLVQISAVLLDRTRAMYLFPFREIARVHPPSHSSTVDAQCSRDGCLRHPFAN